MASDPEIVAFLVDQIANAGTVHAKPMFGEYGLYCDGKMIAMVCDDQLFVKPTAGGRNFAGTVDEAPPYPGAKPCLLVAAHHWDDSDWMTALARITASELPLPEPKSKRAAK